MYDVIILGSGPAGYTAALYTSRAFLKTLVLSGIQLGGQLTITTEVDNYPGFAAGILGPALMDEMKKQVERFGTEVKFEQASSVQRLASSNGFLIETAEKNKYEAKTVIVATGASALYLGIPSEKKLKGKGVSACATCDGFFFKGKEVVVVGGGDTAMEEANFLTKFATRVTIIHRREEFRASKIMLERSQKNPKITFLTNKIVEEVIGDGHVTSVKLKDIKTNEVIDYKTDGFFLAIGHKPNTEFLKGAIDIDEKGYVVVKSTTSSKEPQTRTSVEGIFAAGDCVDPRYRQAVVAAGMGCMAAMDTEKWLEEQGETMTSDLPELQWHGKKWQ